MSEPAHATDEVVLTPMRRTDVAELARIHERAFSGFFLASLGTPFLREFYRGYLTDPSAVAIVARHADTGRPIGCAVGTVEPEGFYGRLLRRRGLAFALAGARAALTHPRVVAPRLLAAVKYRGDTPAGSGGALFASMCVDPNTGSRGVGGRLSRAWSEGAAARGATRAYLTTDADDNDAVNRHHRRHGWSIDADYRTPAGRHMYRYVKALTPAAGENGADPAQEHQEKS